MSTYIGPFLMDRARLWHILGCVYIQWLFEVSDVSCQDPWYCLLRLHADAKYPAETASCVVPII